MVDGQPVTGQTRAMASSLVAEFVPENGATGGRKRVPFDLAASTERALGALLPQGQFRFEVTPTAQVSLDTHAFGNVTTGSVARVAAGDYRITIKRSGYPDFSNPVQVRAGQETLARYAYNFATGTWVVR